ncbi:MAG TPA: hypothetical protein VKD90_23990 [Gemmataceae bacterium]|nr:hypothetical protein [Gemmataceae bacterium]
MSLNRWKVLACTLTVGVGGLAVFARPPAADKTDPPAEPAPLPTLTVKPASPANGTDTPPPEKPPQGAEFDLDIPAVPPPLAKADEPAKKPGSESVFEPISPPAAPVIIQVKGEEPTKDVPAKGDVPKVPDPAPPEIKVPTPAKPEPTDPPKPEPARPDIPKIELDPIPSRVKVETPAITPPTSLPVETPPTSPPLIPDAGKAPPPPPAITPAPFKEPAPAARADGGGKLKMLVRMGDGRPRFEIRSLATTELLLKVYGEKVEVQAPPDATSALAGVTATGRVRFTAPGIEGTCDHLSILSGTGEVLLKGNIHLKSKNGKGWSEMTAEKMVYQIGTAGLSAPANKPPVRPASYIPD